MSKYYTTAQNKHIKHADASNTEISGSNVVSLLNCLHGTCAASASVQQTWLKIVFRIVKHNSTSNKYMTCNGGGLAIMIEAYNIIINSSFTVFVVLLAP